VNRTNGGTNLLGCHPIEGMVGLAVDETVELSIRAQMYKELAQYVASKGKAMQVTGKDGSPGVAEMTFFGWLVSINGKRLGAPSER
jgi:hypothetical protein